MNRVLGKAALKQGTSVYEEGPDQVTDGVTHLKPNYELELRKLKMYMNHNLRIANAACFSRPHHHRNHSL